MSQALKILTRALYAGPGLRWALMGQHLTFQLGGGEGGIEYFIDHIGTGFEALWKSMDDWTAIPPEAKDMLAKGVKQENRPRIARMPQDAPGYPMVKKAFTN